MNAVYSNEQLVEIILQELQSAGLFSQAPSVLPAAPIPLATSDTACDAPAAEDQAPFLQAAPACHSSPKRIAVLRDDSLRQMQEATSARIGVGRAGPRLKTQTLLQLRADHAAARDSVAKDVSLDLLEKLNLFTVQTQCKDMDEYLTRPDLGRVFDESAVAAIKAKCKPSPRVQIYAAGGLSSTALEANLANILPTLSDCLAAKGIQIGTPFYVKYGRVATQDVISEILDAEVVCVLIGERPGLATAESLSAYISYRAAVNMSESRRTVISNIHKGGIAAVEAGAYIADVIELILKAKASGIDLKR